MWLGQKSTFKGITAMLWELHIFQRGHKNVKRFHRLKSLRCAEVHLQRWGEDEDGPKHRDCEKDPE